MKTFYLALLYSIVLFSCQKKVPLMEITANPSQSNNHNPVNIESEIGLPALTNDSVFGYIICNRPNYPIRFSKSYVFPYFSKDSTPLNFIYDGVMPDHYNGMVNETDTNSLIIEFNYNSKYYRVSTKRAFSNCIFDIRYQPQGILTYTYKLKYNGPKINTDTIETCTNQLISPNDTMITLQTCNSTANYNKPTRFMISFKNYEHFKLNGRYFVIIKQATHDFTNY